MTYFGKLERCMLCSVHVEEIRSSPQLTQRAKIEQISHYENILKVVDDLFPFKET
jgi:hypothetical protein